MAIPLGRPLRLPNNQLESLNIKTRIAGGKITQQIKEQSKVMIFFITFFFWMYY